LNFFEQQDQARRQSRWLLVLFGLAVIAIVAAIDLAVLIGLGARDVPQGTVLPAGELLVNNASLLAGASLATLGIIGGSSLFRMARLKSGGGQVARELGGTLVQAESRDPLHRRLFNVVEEIALASGVPVPEIYVLEREDGINAFAAGFTISDAAVAVTRGALEKLSRNELQGVIAHEFSHIFNGDMRINIRLMGALFGILVLAVIGRRVLLHSRHVGRSRDKGGAAVLLIAFALMLVGYIGLFFGRWIKAAVSRQREFLADASAVQFTRDPDSIGGALKKIAVHGEASYLQADTEEVGHMLFGAGQKMNLFATHPPLMQRIQRIDPRFDSEQLLVLADRIRRADERRARSADAESKRAKRASGQGFDAGNIMQEIGNPGWDRLVLAAAVVAALPAAAARAARSPEWANELLLMCLMSQDDDMRERQLLEIAQILGAESEARVRSLLEASAGLQAEQRLPLLELALPTVKQNAPDTQAQLLQAVDKAIQADGTVDVFEYLVARLIRQYLWEAANPRRAARPGRKRLESVAEEAASVLAILALHGHADPVAAEQAFGAGMAQLGHAPGQPPTMPGDWVSALDRALGKLDGLNPAGRQRLVEAMIETATADKVVAAEELELMRATCAALHVPVPMLGPGAQSLP
jgi:Zn-dependent protease with chaperone function